MLMHLVLCSVTRRKGLRRRAHGVVKDGEGRASPEPRIGHVLVTALQDGYGCCQRRARARRQCGARNEHSGKEPVVVAAAAAVLACEHVRLGAQRQDPDLKAQVRRDVACAAAQGLRAKRGASRPICGAELRD